MDQLKLTEKVIELMDRNRNILIVHETRYGFHMQYGDLYLDILGGNSTEKPSCIDVKFCGGDIGRLEYREPNKYYPSPNDADILKTGMLYLSIWETLKADRNFKKRIERENKEREFFSA